MVRVMSPGVAVPVTEVPLDTDPDRSILFFTARAVPSATEESSSATTSLPVTLTSLAAPVMEYVLLD